VRRDGEEEARRWARRIAAVYRSSVLNPHHFAHSGEQRRQFIEAYVELKRFAEGRDPHLRR
jgi:hypothetical protein